MLWSTQPSDRPEGMSSEAYGWMLVEDFVKNFNDRRASLFSPGWQVCNVSANLSQDGTAWVGTGSILDCQCMW
jgi:hypothetical protein